LRKKFADLANAFEQRLHDISVELSNIEGPLEVSPNFADPLHIYPIRSAQDQQAAAKSIQTRIPALSEDLAVVADAEAECLAANVEENDYTVFSWQDLEFELGLLIQNVAKKIAFVDNQVRFSATHLILSLMSLFTDRLPEYDQPNPRPTRAIRGYLPLL